MRRYLLTGACLTALIVIIYSQTSRFEFLGFDDPQLVTENLHVRQGVTAPGLRWAFFSAWRENVFYYPLSLVSHMADVSWFGLDAGRHHLTSVALHAAVTLALFTLLIQLCGSVRRPALAAALFAGHPLCVDSVAWVAERSNVLCALLSLTAMSAYLRYGTVRRLGWYGLSLGLLVLALLAKPTAVMAPVVLFLFHGMKAGAGPPGSGARAAFRPVLPFAFLAGVRLLALLAAQRGASPVTAAGAMTAGTLAANALVAAATYPVKAVYPFYLSVYYPFPESLPLWQPVAAGLVLLLITVMILKAGRRRPLPRLGWLWYLAFLAPSLGAVRSGPWPALADHYAYLPLMGLLMVPVWLVPAGMGRSRRAGAVLAGGGLFLIVFFAAVSFRHAGDYRDSVTLFSRAVSLDQRNFLALIGLGNAYRQMGKTELAEESFRKAIAVRPASAGAHNNLGLILEERGAWTEAERQFALALALDPGLLMARRNLDNLYRKRQASREAGRPRPDETATATTPGE